MATPKKVYDFTFDKVQDQVTAALRRHQHQATVADIVGLSGLPRYQVETVMPAVVSQCRGQMAVTESGEILYKFPQGLRNAEKSWGTKLRRGLTKVLTALFKAWIVVMLVGYFALFVLLLVAAILVSIALSFARRGDDRDDSGGGVMGFYLVTRVIEFFVLLWLYSGDPVERQAKKRKPFHRAVFEFVFGVEPRPEVRAKMERKAFVSLVRQKQGRVSLEDLMALTGASRAEADAQISRFLLEFEGEPQVSEAGTLSFFFPGLLQTSGAPEQPYVLPDKEEIPFTRNPGRTNAWIVALNGTNIVFGLYFLGFGLQGPQAVAAAGDSLSLLYQFALVLLARGSGLGLLEANSWLTAILGFVPALYAAVFFAVPAVRRWREGLKNAAIRLDRLRRRLVAAVLRRPDEIRLDQLEGTGVTAAQIEALLRDLAGPRDLQVVAADPPVFALPDLKREQDDLAQVRRGTDLSRLAIGKVVFDTEDEV